MPIGVRNEMHIQERSNTILTTCTKMTEEVDRRHGMNGNSSGKGTNEDVTLQNSSQSNSKTSGGRLKFFKDGKFILELARAKEGERIGWVSVPRKTFWPPPAGVSHTLPPAIVPQAARNERATSLSVSDDNSSIQSSPWQRDHCWKQTNPRKNISKELALFYCRPASLHSSIIHLGTRLKRRKPYDSTQNESLNVGLKSVFTNGLDAEYGLGINSKSPAASSEDAVDGFPVKVEAAVDRKTTSKYSGMSSKLYHSKLKAYKTSTKGPKWKELSKVVDMLRDKVSALPLPVNTKLASLNCRQEHMMVSPRKRILRELERVSLEDQGSKRRAKTVPTLSTASYPASPGPSNAAPKVPVETQTPPTSKAYNGVPHGSAPRRESSVTKNVSSYSIHSLLSMSEESPARRSPEVHVSKKSPQVYAPLTHKTESPSSVISPDPSPSPENYRYKYPLAAHGGSPVRPRDSPTPPLDHLSRFRSSYLPPPGSPYAPHPAAPLVNAYPARRSPVPSTALPQHKSPQYYPALLASPSQLSSPHYRGSPTPKRSPGPDATRYLPSPTRESPTQARYAEAWRGEREGAPLAYLYPPAYVSPYVSGLPYRSTAAPLWMHYAMTPGIPPGPWAQLPHPLLTDNIIKEEAGSDLPLNLSKH